MTLEYSICSDLINIHPGKLSRTAARAHVKAIQSQLVDRCEILAKSANINCNLLQEAATWDLITEFAMRHNQYRTLDAGELARKNAGLNAALGPLANLVGAKDLTANVSDWGVEFSDSSRQIGFDIHCLKVRAILDGFPSLKWGLAKTKRTDHPEFQQPAIAGFSRHLEYIPFFGFDKVCWHVKTGSLFKQVELWRGLAAEAAR